MTVQTHGQLPTDEFLIPLSKSKKAQMVRALANLHHPDLPSLRPCELSDALRPTIDRLGMHENLREMEGKGYTVLRNCFTPEGVRSWALHADQPKYDGGLRGGGADPLTYDRNQILTCCIIVSDGYSAEKGATCVVPGSHKLRRYPSQQEQDNCEDLAEPIIANRGDVGCWGGDVWHAFGVRQIPGERVVLHVTYSRDGLGIADSRDDISSSAFEGKPYERQMLQLLRRGGV